MSKSEKVKKKDYNDLETLATTNMSVRIEGSGADITFFTPDFMYENQWC